MNISIRKLEMLEKSMQTIDERARIEGNVTAPIDRDFQQRVSALIEKVRTL